MGHMRRDCPKWKEEKGNGKADDSNDKKKSTVKIEEINVIGTYAEDDAQGVDACKITSAEIYFTSVLESAFLTAKDGYALSDWIIDSGASLHVSPHREWFSSYVATKDLVHLGNEQTCEILGAGDV